MLESRVGTDAPPTQRERQTLENEIKKLKMKGCKELDTETRMQAQISGPPSQGISHHTATFSKTQNLKDIFRGINDCFSGEKSCAPTDTLMIESINFSMSNSIFQSIDPSIANKRKTDGQKPSKKASIMSILQKNQSSQQTRAKEHLQNLQLSRVNGSLFASSKSRDKTPNTNSSGPV